MALRGLSESGVTAGEGAYPAGIRPQAISAVSSKIITLWWGFMRLEVTELDDAIGGMEYMARLALKSSESSFEMCCYAQM